jgi:hypothetical protein
MPSDGSPACLALAGRVARTNERVLFWPVLGFLIVYRHEVKPIEVVRVVSGRRDLRAVFRGQQHNPGLGWRG